MTALVFFTLFGTALLFLFFIFNGYYDYYGNDDSIFFCWLILGLIEGLVALLICIIYQGTIGNNSEDSIKLAMSIVYFVHNFLFLIITIKIGPRNNGRDEL